ncbi:MAG: DAK2 domain-containing protein [Firmicutes bacterium]|nr:DAK2 domain-containing protein [Bacillota bacterium]
MIDGKLLAQMFLSGANNLYNNRRIVDELNVFPVPDGDTGTNMSMTAQNMAKSLLEVQSDSVTRIADVMSFATLRGARGNSGVILSQFFRGIAKSLKGKSECDAHELAEALMQGSEVAYNAVMNPTEGTILTVAKAAAKAAVSAENDILAVFTAAAQEGNETLSRTPDMLPTLKKAGVVDAGGQGWVFVLEGVLYYLQNNKIVECDKKDGSEEPQKSESAQKKVSDQNIKYIYCTEFIVEKRQKGADVLSFKRAIEKTGDSMLVIDDDDIVKVHIHTNNPGFVLENAIKLGTMINIKIDNMKHQHQSLIENEEPKEEEEEEEKEFGFVTVCAGGGIAKIFKDLGADAVIEGGQTMNPSTDDILSAANGINAKTIFVFPNNKNIILAANQAMEISKKHIVVIPTKSIPEGVCAMMKFNSEKSADDNEKAMNKAAQNVTSAQITYAVRDTESEDKVIKKDDILGLVGGKIQEVGKNPDDVLFDLLEGIVTDDSEFITIYYGEDIEEDRAEKTAEKIENMFEDAEVFVKYGGQPLYYYVISVE